MMLASFDVLFVTETWRGERQELFTTTHGHVLFLSGGEGCRGVGIVLSVGFFRELLQVSFPCLFTSNLRTTFSIWW